MNHSLRLQSELLDLNKQIWKLQPKMRNGKPPILILAAAAVKKRQAAWLSSLSFLCRFE